MKIEEILHTKRGLSKAFIRKLIKQKYLSPNQVAILTGKSVSSILNLSVPKTKKTPTLTRAYPYPVSDENKGGVFIRNDEQLIKLIKKYNNE